MLIVSLAAMLVTPSAFAQSAGTSLATIQNFNYELIDLMPSDGIAPSVELSSGQRSAEANLFSYPDGRLIAHSLTLNYGSVEVSVAGSTAQSSFAPQTARSEAGAVIATFAEATAFDTIDFVLSPHARLIFSGDAHVAVQQNLAGNVYARAMISGEIPSSPFPSTGTQFSSSVESALGENSQMLSVAVNSGVEEAVGYVQLSTVAQALSSIPAIAEPSAALMICAGLGLLTLARECRRLRNSTAAPTTA
jgi:hypothetical protein